MLSFAALGFILWILVLLWRINTKTVTMPVKGEESSAHCGLPATKEAAQTPHPGKHSLSTVPTTSTGIVTNSPLAEGISAGSEVKRGHSEPSQYKTNKPMLSSGPEARERLKFILGASEDNSSDEEPQVAKPPSGATQPPASTPRSSPEQPSSAGPPTSSSSIK